VLKLAINISLAVQMLAFAEGLVLAAQSGIDRELALEVMANSSIGSPMLKARAPLVFDLPDEAWFTLALVQKDVELARDVAEGLGVPLPTADRADEVLGLARVLGYERRDLAALVQVLEEMTGGRRTAA
jgi:3-hydroxyisobutyrate dehydrogenase-like beta-hydroxyacid dehydrogenase